MTTTTETTEAPTTRTLSSSSTKTPTEQISSLHAIGAATSSSQVDVCSGKGPPTLDGSTELHQENLFHHGSTILRGPSQNQNPPFAPTTSSKFYSTEYSEKNGSLQEPRICSLCSQKDNEKEIAKMPHFFRQEKNLANEMPNKMEHPDEDEKEDEDDDEIYIMTHDANSIVSGVTLPSDIWTIASPAINTIESSFSLPPYSTFQHKEILSPLSESSSEGLHTETPPSQSLSSSSVPVVQNEQEAQIHHLSRLISQQEELLEKTRQLNDKRKILVYSNIALIIAVALAVGLALGLRKSGDENDNNQIEADTYDATSTQQNVFDFPDYHPSESPSKSALGVVGIPPDESNDVRCLPVEVYAEIMSENDSTSMSGGTVTWSIHDKLSGTQLRSGNFEPDNLFNGMKEGEGKILDKTYCLPNGTFSFQVDWDYLVDDEGSSDIYLAVRTGGMDAVGDELDQKKLLVSVKMKHGSVAKDFTIPPSSNSPSIQPTILHPTINPATSSPLSSPFSSPSTIPSAHPSFRPSEIMHPELTSLPSTSFPVDFSTIPSSQSSLVPTERHISEFLCYQVEFKINAGNNPSNVSVSMVTMPPAGLDSHEPSSIDVTMERMVLFESDALEPNSSFQYDECLPPSEYSVTILSNEESDCCRGHYVITAETDQSGYTSPFSTIRNDTVFNSWDVTTFPLPFDPSSLNVLEIMVSFISKASFDDTNDHLSWEMVHNGVILEPTDSFLFNTTTNPSAYRETKYLSTGEYQFIGHNVQVGSFRLTTFDGFDDLGVTGEQIICTAVRDVRFHSITFPLPLITNQYHLLEVYLETPTSYGPEIYWEVRNASDEYMVLTNYSPYENNERYLEGKYLSTGSYVFVIYDFTSQGLGDVGKFEVLLNGDVIHSFDSVVSESWYQYDFSFEVP